MRWRPDPDLILEILLLLITPIGCYRILRAWRVDRVLSILISLFFTVFLLISMVYIFTALGILLIFILLMLIYRLARGKKVTEIWR